MALIRLHKIIAHDEEKMTPTRVREELLNTDSVVSIYTSEFFEGATTIETVGGGRATYTESIEAVSILFPGGVVN